MTNMKLQALFGVIACAVSLALAPAHAAADRDESKVERAKSETERAASKAERAASKSERAKSEAERAASRAERADSKTERAESKVVEKGDQKKREARNATSATSDTESCRREAQGKHGPDRSDFMTECLRRTR